jgi:hypothetical protein
MELLEQKPLGADAVELLLQRDQQQLLGRNRWSASCGVELTEGEVQSTEA